MGAYDASYADVEPRQHLTKPSAQQMSDRLRRCIAPHRTGLRGYGTAMTVTPVDTGPRRVSRTCELPTTAQELFAVLADPHRHGELDGSGTVKDTVKGPRRLQQNARFSVNMKQYGVAYRITSKVTQFVPDRIIEWRHPLGHRWRWELLPQNHGATTRVTETFDYSTISNLHARALELLGIPKQNAAGIEATLTKLQKQHA